LWLALAFGIFAFSPRPLWRFKLALPHDTKLL